MKKLASIMQMTIVEAASLAVKAVSSGQAHVADEREFGNVHHP